MDESTREGSQYMQRKTQNPRSQEAAVNQVKQGK